MNTQSVTANCPSHVHSQCISSSVKAKITCCSIYFRMRARVCVQKLVSEVCVNSSEGNKKVRASVRACTCTLLTLLSLCMCMHLLAYPVWHPDNNSKLYDRSPMCKRLRGKQTVGAYVRACTCTLLNLVSMYVFVPPFHSCLGNQTTTTTNHVIARLYMRVLTGSA